MSEIEPRLTAALAERYRIEREVGAGGMAIVFLAEDVKHHRQVAVKVLRPELAAAIGHQRFLREIEISAGLSHPHVLPLYDSGEADGLLYCVMPYVEGESLRDRLEREKQLPLDDALRYSREGADALSYAHSRGVIHRDIKPENIMLGSGHAVVTDFGIARAIDAAGGERLTQTGVAVGTPTYMSPEQAAGDEEIDGRSDLYALGCVLFEMLAGRPPFAGATVESVVRQHLLADPPSVTNIRPAVPAEVAAAVQRALAKNPADRFNPVAQFSQALSGPPRATASVERPSRRTRHLVIGLGALAVLLGGGLYLQWTRPGSAPAVGRTVQVTRDPGLELDPALSPDGQLVAYAAGPADAMRIFVRRVDGGGTVALTENAIGSLRWPRWSPDGTQIAYQAPDGIYVVPALGGSPRLVVRAPELQVRISESSLLPLTGLDWSPDGRSIVFGGNYGAEGLYLVPIAGGQPRRIAGPREPNAPAWSPDGSKIAVTSGNLEFSFGIAYLGNQGASSIWVVPVEEGEPVRVTEEAYQDISPVWSADGRHLFWVSDRGGARDVYRVSVDRRGAPQGDPQRLTTGSNAQAITLSADDRMLAYASMRTLSNVWSMPVPPAGARTPVSISAARPVTTGNQTIEDVDVTRDGQWLVFDSDRNGNSDIYKMRVGTTEPVQLTIDPAGDYSPAWSSDGRRVLFHSLRFGNRDLFTVEADGTGLTRRTRGTAHELDGDWSPDGDAVVAEVMDAEGIAEQSFLVLPLEGPESGARRLPATGDFAAWSPDGRLIAYHALDGIRVIAPDGGDSRLIVSNEEDGSEAFYAAWSPDARTLYYLARGEDGWMIRAAPRDGSASRVLVVFDDPTRQHSRYGFATDGSVFYFTMGAHESDVWALEFDTR
ncbi:MAG: protein kinase [Gemmatimonadota bacterium]